MRSPVHDLAADGAAQGAGPAVFAAAHFGEAAGRVLGHTQAQTEVFKALLHLAEKSTRDGQHVALVQAAEDDDLIHAVEKLRLEGGAQLRPHLIAHDTLTAAAARKAQGQAAVGDGLGPDVRGHDHHGVGKVHPPSCGVGQVPVIHDLQQDAPHVLVGLLDLVEQDHRPGAAPHLLGELSAVLVAHIARGRADEAADRVLFHILGHVEADDRPGVTEDRVGQCPAELGLAHARGAAEEEGADRARRVLEPHAPPADRPRHGGHRLILPDDALLQAVLQGDEPLALALGESRHRDARPDGQHAGYIRLRHICPTLHPHGGPGLVEKVDGLVGQKAVVDIAHGEGAGGLHRGVGKAHAVVLFQRRAQGAKHLHRELHVRLAHLHGLEAPLKGRVLFNVAAVFLGRRGADDLHLAPAQGGL